MSLVGPLRLPASKGILRAGQVSADQTKNQNTFRLFFQKKEPKMLIFSCFVQKTKLKKFDACKNFSVVAVVCVLKRKKPFGEV